MQLALGTVQFGLDYGVSNQAGRCPPDEVGRILASARRYGIDLLDTAPAYGSAETTLSPFLRNSGPFRIVTKTPRPAAGAVRASFDASLQRLDQTKVYGLLVHDTDEFLGPAGSEIERSMQALKETGRVAKIGVSVYTGEQIDGVLARFTPDLVQLPISVLDQRLRRSGALRRLKDRGVEIHARSVFLQGLLLMAPDNLPRHLAGAAPIVTRFQSAARAAGLSPVAGALAFTHRVAEIDYVVAGVCSAQEFEEVAEAAAAARAADLPWDEFAVQDETLINPSLWPPKAAVQQASANSR